MKRVLLSVLAVAGILSAASCQRENLEPVQQSNTVTYTVQLADAVGTKALGDDVKAVNELVYEVWRTQGTEITAFDAEKDNLLYHRTTTDVNDGVATLELEFVNDQNFIVLFWAQTEGNGVYDATKLTEVKIASPDVANNPNAQAFVGRDFVRDCVSAKDGKVTLTRPVAQLNIGTTYASLDAFNPGGEADVTITGSSVEVTGLSTSYNVATLAAGEASKVAYKYNYDDSCRLPSEPLNVNGTDYKYVAMNYVGFPANDGSNVTVTYVINTSEGNIDNADAPIANVPVKANYRTNIIGNLITSKTDYTVTLDKTWEKPAEVVEMWDGETLKAPKTNAAGEYVIECASELAWLAAAVNGTLPPTTRAAESPAPNNFEGKTIILSENIHLNNKEWTPIGNGSAHFHGTFDGKGHTIYGLSILKYHGQRQHALFGSVAINPTIKNLIIDGANVIMPEGHDDDFYASALISSFYGTLKVQNVTVQNSNFAGNNKIGGLLAHDAECTSMIIDNCHVLNCDIRSTHKTDGGNVGGLLGFFQGQPNNEHKITNSSVKESTIIAINSKNSGHRSNGQFVGCLSGKDNQILVIEDCVIEGNDFSQTINGTDPVTYVSPYGVFVGGNRNDDGKGTVIVDGRTMIQDGLAQEGTTYYVSSAAAFQAALDRYAADEKTTNATFVLLDDINGDVNFTQVPKKSFVFDGQEKKMTGSIKFLARAGESESSILIKNFNFETTDNERDFILSSETNYYPNNVTISNCKFKGAGADSDVVPVRVKSAYNLVIENCEADAVHSFFQNDRGGKNYAISNCKVTNAGRGMSLNSVIGASIENVEISAKDDKYGIRINAENSCTISITDCKVSAFIPVVVRAAKVDVVLEFHGNETTMTPANTDGLWCAIGTSEYDTNGEMPSDPTGKVTVTLDDTGLKKSGVYGGYFPPVAKVGNTEYGDIDKAIAEWTNNTTLTLLDNVTLSDVVKLKSTEHHILNLATYTMTAASGQHAIEITCEGRSSASYALTVNADATNPGGITATGKACIYYKKSGSTKDRPIILINNGVFTGSYSINSTSNGNTNCPQIWINGGVFNSYMNLTKNLLKVSGGTFHASINCTGDQNAYRQISGGRFKSWQFMTDDASNKFAVTSVMSKDDKGNWIGTYDVGCYVDDDNYLVVGGNPITEFDDRFEAKAKCSVWSRSLKYSSAADGLYYTKKDNIPDSDKSTPQNENILELNPNKTF